MTSEQWKQLAEKHFKQPGIDFVKEAVVLELIPKADALVLASPNKIDDLVWAQAKEMLLKALEQLGK